jgi:hypothetical protein
MTRIYVGVTRDIVPDVNGHDCLRREVFRSAATPTEASHGPEYICVIGPFLTRRGAEFMARFGAGNPHCQDVRAAEKLARYKMEEKHDHR